MKPILFDKSATNFSTNGIGRLECISCHVIEERNGMFELEAVIPVNGEHTADVEMESIIGAIPHDGGTVQAFRVYKISKPINGKYTVYARHITYRLSDIPTMPFSISASPSAAANTLAGLKNNAAEECPFNFYTDVTTANSYKQDTPASIRERLGGVQGSVLDQFGGEYEWDNFDVHLWKQRGRLANITGITLRYGKNITDINQEEEIASTITGIVPFWVDADGNNLVTLPEEVVYSPNAGNFAYHITKAYDFSANYQDQPTVEQLRSAATAYVNKSDFGVPKVSIRVSFVNLWETEEYKDIAPLERVQLCDEINIQFERLGIEAVAKVVKTDYDVLAERYIGIEVGNIRDNLTQAVTDRDKEIDTAFLNQITKINKQIADATAWLTSANGYVVAVKNTDGSWKELLFMDTNDPSTAHNVIRINNNGIGISTNGIAGPYSTAWTIDGRFGDAANKNYWNLLTGEFKLSANANIYDTNAMYRGAYVPTNENAPASSWTDAQKEGHVGETFLDVANYETYIYKNIPPVPLETEHPYPTSQNLYFHVTVNLTAPVYITFDEQSFTENGYDYITLYQPDGTGYKSSDKLTGDLGGKRYKIASNEFWLKWVSDSSVTNWGWKITTIDNSPEGTYIEPVWVSDILPSVTWTDIDYTVNEYGWVKATVDEYISAKTQQITLTQEEIYNILTNNGQEQGIFLQDGKLFLNGQYFTSNAITIGGAQYTQKPYLEIKDSGGGLIGKWDVDGLIANKGDIAGLTIGKNVDGLPYLRFAGDVAGAYISKEWEEGQITDDNRKGTITINPYVEGWSEDYPLDVWFDMNLTNPTTAQENAAQCSLQLTKVSESSSTTIKNVTLNYLGNRRDNEDIHGLDDVILDHTWGKNPGEYYVLKWAVYKRAASYAYYTTFEVSGYGENFYLGMVEETVGRRTSVCIGKFRGSFEGNGYFGNLDLGRWNYDGTQFIGESPSGNSYIRLKPQYIHVSDTDDFTDDYMRISSASITHRDSGTNYYAEFSASDERVKHDIEPLDMELSRQLIDGTQARSFKFNGNEIKHYGMIAQEARELLDGLGETDSGLEYTAGTPDDDIPNQQDIRYHEYIPHLINYVKDLRAEIEALKQRRNTDD